MELAHQVHHRPGRWEVLAAACLAACFFLAGLARMNDLSLYTDSTRYLIWGNSLAQGDGFVDRTLPEPTRFVMNAPLYPVLLVPSQLASPWSLDAAKLWTLAWGAAAVVLLFFWMRRSFGPLPSLTAAAFFALHPLFFVVSTEVLSEAPFVALLLAAMLALEPRPGPSPGLLNFATVLLVLLPLVREVGFAFSLAASVVLANTGRARRAAVVVGLSALLLVLWNLRNSLFLGELQSGQAANMQFIFGHFVTPQGDSMASEFVTRLWLNAKGYFWTIGGSLFYPFPSSLVHDPTKLYMSLDQLFGAGRLVVFLVALGLALHGVMLDIGRPGAGLFRPLAVVLFLLIVLVYPVHELRFLLPILPLLLMFIVRSAVNLAERFVLGASLRLAAGLFFAVLVSFPNVVAVTELVDINARYRANPEAFATEVLASEDPSAFYTRPWKAMGAWMLQQLPPACTIASPAKEIAPYVPGLSVLELSRSVPGPLFDRSLRDNGATYLLAATVWSDFRTYEFAMSESRRFQFEPVHTAGALTLYRVLSRLSSAARETPLADTASFTASALLRRGRRHVLALEYIEALGTLNEAARLAPAQAEITAQQILASSIVGDIAGSRSLFQRLFTMPQSTPHVSLAQAHLNLAEQLKIASEEPNAVERSRRAIEAGRQYWDLGYSLLGLRIMQNVLRLDSTSFEAALWACHFARQTGDTVSSRRYLETLKDIDITAVIITDLDALDRLGQRLSRTAWPQERVRLLIELAGIYEKLELFEEALDELEKALANAPGDAGLLAARASILGVKKAAAR